MVLKVLHCVHSLNASDGGPARSVPALAAAESRAGANVRIWSCRPPTIRLSSEERSGLEFLGGSVESAISDSWVPDLIHDHGLWLGSNHACARMGRHKRIPRIVSPRGMLEPWCLRHRWAKKMAAWQFYQYRDLKSAFALHATSPSEAAQFRRIGFTQHVIQLPNGVSLPQNVQYEKKTTGKRIREVLFLSRIHPVKGLLNLIEAWAQCATSEWKLRIVGSDEDGHRAQVLKAIEEKNLSATVVVEDAVHSAEKWNILGNADVLVLPSFSENFGIVVAEALAVGTPVITTTGTPWQRVIAERCGWYVEPTVAGLLAGLNNAMKSGETELKAMGRRGRCWVQKEFAWADIGFRMLQSYENLLNGRVAHDLPISSATGRLAA